MGVSKEVKYLQLKRYCKEKVPFNIKAIQTDNGLRFKKHFDKYG